MPETHNEPVSRSKRVKLSPAITKVLMENQAQAKQLSTALQTLSMADQRLVAALTADAGYKLDEFERWDYENGKDGATYLVLIPAPLPPPGPPQRPTPKQEG